MRGVGGPLLCVGDLLSDVGDPEEIETPTPPAPPPSLPSSPSEHLDFQPSHLAQLFQEHYDELNKALAGTDHSWTCLTLKLCNALDTAKKLIDSTNSNVIVLSHKVGELENILHKGDSAIADLRSIHCSLTQLIAPPSHSQP